VALVTGDSFPQRRAARARRTSPISALRWPNRAGLRSGTGYATCVIHLGPWRGSERLEDAVAMVAAALHGGARRHARACCSGHRKGRKWGRSRARCKGKPKPGDVVAVQCCREPAPVEQRWRSTVVLGLAARMGYDLLHLAQKVQKRALVLTEGSDWPEKQRRVAGGEVQAAGMGRNQGRSCCRGPPGFWTPWICSEWCWEGTTRVKEDRNTPAERNHGGGATYRRQLLVQFRPLHGPGLRVKSLGSSLAPRRSDCGGWPGLGCGGAAGPRRSRRCCAAERAGGGLGFGAAATG
jgi:hypothetical protein